MSEESYDPYVCRAKHSALNYVLGLLIGLTALFSTGVGWSVYAGWSATAEAAGLKLELREYKAQQQSEVKHIQELLAEQKSDLKEIKNSINELTLKVK